MWVAAEVDPTMIPGTARYLQLWPKPRPPSPRFDKIDGIVNF
jgi:hypothetical protein